MARRGQKTKANGHSEQPISDGLPPDEVFNRWLDKIRPAVGKLNKIVESARRQRAVVSDLYDRAGKDGINRKGFKDAIAVMAKAADEVALEQRTTGRVLRLAEHALVTEHGLFPDLPLSAKPQSAYAMGQKVGRAGGSLDECPFQPGSENFIEWRDGYEAGQRANREGLRTSADATV